MTDTFLKKFERDRAAAFAAVKEERESLAAGGETPEIYAKYSAAFDAVGEKFDRIWEQHCAEEDRKDAVAERKRQKEIRAAEREQERRDKADKRQRVADKFALSQQITEAVTPPEVLISPKQAAARLNMTLRQFWKHVASGRYPQPRPENGNRFEVAVIDRLPRPKVRVQRVVPRNVLTDIFKF